MCWADKREETLLLADFGMAATVNEQSSYAGSAHYAAPEVLELAVSSV